MISHDVDYERWLAGITAHQLAETFRSKGCSQVLVKQLADRQDNDKNQIYMGSDLTQVGKIPSGEVTTSTTTSTKAGAAGRTKFTAPVDLIWITPDGDSPAPKAKLIYYPQYPEVRLSGLLAGSRNPPRSLYSRALRGQEPNRVLMLGVAPQDNRVWAIILPPESTVLQELSDLALEPYGVFRIWSLGRERRSGRELLLDRLNEIQSLGWLAGQRISRGSIVPYQARNAGGYTLEALLGVAPNGIAEPDFEGWEIKALATRSLQQSATGPVTLMTPEPTGGAYQVDVKKFMRTYGYTNPSAPDRYDFTGRHFVSRPPLAKTGTSLEVHGWDGARGLEPDGAIALLGPAGELAATWGFEGLMTHWKRKHAQCCYVPYETRESAAGREYRFGNVVHLCEGTTFLQLLHGFADQLVYYDPGLKMTRANGSAEWRVKKRSQFRVAYREVPRLYGSTMEVDLTDH